jgi:hypothetical protein
MTANLTVTLVRIFAQAPVAAFAMIVALGSAERSFGETITVQDHRPVARAIAEMERRYGWQVTYEDPPYANRSALVDITDLVQRDRTEGVGIRTLAPKEDTLVVTVPAARTAAQRFGAVELLVKNYNARSGGNMFAVLRGDKFLHVVPRHASGPSGKLESVTPILDTAITISPKARTAVALIEHICEEISLKTKQEVVLGVAPLNLLANQKTFVSASNDTARSILEHVLAGNEARLSWRVLYDPGLRWHVLNIHAVSKGDPKP